jgi:hypothetical protein
LFASPVAAVTLVVDNNNANNSAGDVFSFTGIWTSANTTSGGLFYGNDFLTHRGSQGAASATWRPTLPTSGSYEVYVRHTTGPSRTTAAQFTVDYDGGSQNVSVNQSINGGQWILVGTFPFVAGTAGSVHLIADTGSLIFTVADAVRWVSVSIPDTVPPVVTVTSPNGGELWEAGSAHNLTWTATDDVGVTAIDLEYSTDGGTSWTLIASGQANSGSYPWTVPATTTAAGRVRVTAYDAAANSGNDISDANFRILDTTSPAVTVIAPNGGESWAAGSSQTITWTASDYGGVSSVDLAYSADGGTSWALIASGQANSGSHSWTVPNVPTTTARVRVTATDGPGNSGSDMSDANFTIVGGSGLSVTVISPNGGEVWEAGSAHNLTWTATDDVGVTAVDLEYSTNGGSSWTLIAAGEANSGSYPWVAPATTGAGRIRVTAHDAAANSESDASDANFNIVDTTSPAVAVTSPNGGESWTIGSSQDITWTATDYVGVGWVDLEYSTNGGASWTLIASGQANSGSHAWTVPNTPSTTARVRVTATDGAGNARSDASDADFAIVEATVDIPVNVPVPLSLQPSFPSPFVASTTIPYGLPSETNVRLTIHDARGRILRTLVDQLQGAGVHTLQWDGKLEDGTRAARGFYIVRLQAGKEVRSRSVILSR